MSKVKAVVVSFFQKLASDTLTAEKSFNEKTSRVARGFTNFG